MKFVTIGLVSAVQLDKKARGVDSGLPIPICNGANQGACFEADKISEAAWPSLAQKNPPCLDFDKDCVKENSYRHDGQGWN